MAIIYIDNIKPVGSDLLSDEESFLNDLSSEQQILTYGGVTPWFILAVGAAAFGYQVGRGDRQK